MWHLFKIVVGKHLFNPNIRDFGLSERLVIICKPNGITDIMQNLSSHYHQNDITRSGPQPEANEKKISIYVNTHLLIINTVE